MTVQDFMFVSGIPINLTGYEYIKEAIEMHVEAPGKRIMSIYEDIAKRYDITAYSVERNIRHAIQKGYPRLNSDIKKKLFDNKERVKVSEYIRGVSYAIRNDLF